MVCPRCEQDYLRTLSVATTGDSGLVCDECDALWLAGVDFPFPGWAQRTTFMEENDLEREDVSIGPKTGEDPPPVDVRIRRRVQPAGTGQPLVYVVGDMGKPRTPCAYCPDGNLVGALLLSSGERFFFCKTCEAVWPTTEAAATEPPTFLDPYLRSRDAEWADVEQVVGSTE